MNIEQIKELIQKLKEELGPQAEKMAEIKEEILTRTSIVEANLAEIEKLEEQKQELAQGLEALKGHLKEFGSFVNLLNEAE